MNYKFHEVDLGDKYKIILVVDGKKESTMFKMKEKNISCHDTLKEAKDSMLLNYKTRE